MVKHAEYIEFNSFGEYVKYKRALKGLTIADVSSAAKISAPFQIKIEKNQVQNLEISYLATVNNLIDIDFFTALDFLNVQMPISCRMENIFDLFENFRYQNTPIDKNEIKQHLITHFGESSYIPERDKALTFGGLLKKQRNRRGYFLTDIRLRLGSHNQFISSIENDYPRKKYLGLLADIAYAYELDMVDVFFYALERKPLKYVDIDALLKFGPRLIYNDNRIPVKELRKYCTDSIKELEDQEEE